MWWVTVFVYWTVSLLCVRAAMTSLRRRPWVVLGGFAIILSVNKQFKLSSAFTFMLKKDAFRNHWYLEREGLQMTTLVIIALVCAVSLISLAVITNRLSWTRVQKTILAIFIFLVAFALTRSTSLHAIDTFLYRERHGIMLNWVIELGALVPVLLMLLLTVFPGLKNQKQTHSDKS